MVARGSGSGVEEMSKGGHKVLKRKKKLEHTAALSNRKAKLTEKISSASEGLEQPELAVIDGWQECALLGPLWETKRHRACPPSQPFLAQQKPMHVVTKRHTNDLPWQHHHPYQPQNGNNPNARQEQKGQL